MADSTQTQAENDSDLGGPCEECGELYAHRLNCSRRARGGMRRRELPRLPARRPTSSESHSVDLPKGVRVSVVVYYTGRIRLRLVGADAKYGVSELFLDGRNNKNVLITLEPIDGD